MNTTKQHGTARAAQDFQRGYEPANPNARKTGIGPQGRQPKASHESPGVKLEGPFSDEESE